jgi:hypothetical protein
MSTEHPETLEGGATLHRLRDLPEPEPPEQIASGCALALGGDNCGSLRAGGGAQLAARRPSPARRRRFRAPTLRAQNLELRACKSRP